MSRRKTSEMKCSFDAVLIIFTILNRLMGRSTLCLIAYVSSAVMGFTSTIKNPPLLDSFLYRT